MSLDIATASDDLQEPGFFQRNKPLIIGAVVFITVIGGIIGGIAGKLYGWF